MEIASECCEQGLKDRTKFSSRSDMICMCVCSKQKSIRSFSTSIRSARDSSKACKKARKQDVTSNGFRAWRSWVRRMRRGVKLQAFGVQEGKQKELEVRNNRTNIKKQPNKWRRRKQRREKSGVLTWSTAIKRWWTQESKLSWSSWSRSSSSKDVDDKCINALSTDWSEVFAKTFNELCEQCSKNWEVSL